MRQEIEFEYDSPRGERRLTLMFAACFVASLSLALLHAQAETKRAPARQSGGVSGGDSHGASPRGVPPHTPGYLGVLFRNLDDEQLSMLHLKSGGRGVEVEMVDHDGPAGKAGLQPHDVIVALNGQPVQSADMLRKMIHDDGAGANVALTVVRAGREMTTSAQLAYRGTVEREAMERMALPDSAGDGGEPVVSGFVESYEVENNDPSTSRGAAFLAEMLHIGPFTGLVLEAMEPQLAGYFGVTGAGGLLVETVMPDSPAANAGLRAGDVIERVDSVGVKSTSEWMRHMRASKERPVTLTIIRDKRESTVTMKPQLKKHSELEWLGPFYEAATMA